MADDSIIHDDKLSRGPFTCTLVLMHVIRKVCKNQLGQRRPIGENDALFSYISRVRPADWIANQPDIITIGRYFNSREFLRDNSAVTVL